MRLLFITNLYNKKLNIMNKNLKYFINMTWTYNSEILTVCLEFASIGRQCNASGEKRCKKSWNEYGPWNRIMMNAYIPMEMRNCCCIYHYSYMLTFMLLHTLFLSYSSSSKVSSKNIRNFSYHFLYYYYYIILKYYTRIKKCNIL